MDIVMMGPKHDGTYLLEEADVSTARRIGNVGLAVGESDKVGLLVTAISISEPDVKKKHQEYCVRPHG